MKLAVFGQRSIDDKHGVLTKFRDLMDEQVLTDGHITYLHGGAKGPQAIVLEDMKVYHDIVLFQPWSMVTNRLGSFSVEFFDYRNKQIIDNADEVIVFDNGQPDREADYVLSYVRRFRKPYHLIKM